MNTSSLSRLRGTKPTLCALLAIVALALSTLGPAALGQPPKPAEATTGANVRPRYGFTGGDSGVTSGQRNAIKAPSFSPMYMDYDNPAAEDSLHDETARVHLLRFASWCNDSRTPRYDASGHGTSCSGTSADTLKAFAHDHPGSVFQLGNEPGHPPAQDDGDCFHKTPARAPRILAMNLPGGTRHRETRSRIQPTAIPPPSSFRQGC